MFENDLAYFKTKLKEKHLILILKLLKTWKRKL